MDNPVDKFRLQQSALRDGIPVEKGVVTSEEQLEKNFELFGKWMNYFMIYPDLFLDMTKSQKCPINLFFYQRLLLRVMMRYRYVFGTFTRATSKSFIAFLSQILACVFEPRSKRFVVSNYKKASIDIAKAKIEEIFTWYPLLKNEVAAMRQSSDYIEIEFKNKSIFQVLTLSASSRGQRATGGIIEEAAMVDGVALSEVIIPMMNIPRLRADGTTCKDEPHAQQLYITSAGSKVTFAYERLIELLINECINPEDVFVCGSGYELPCYYGLFDKKTIEDQKNSSSFSDLGFARESLSIWTGVSEDSWFNQEKLLRSRSLLYCEREAHLTKNNENVYYEIGVDVARYKTNDTSIMVVKVFPHTGAWTKKVIYTENISGTTFQSQAARIKEIIKLYNPREVVIDGNGINFSAYIK